MAGSIKVEITSGPDPAFGPWSATVTVTSLNSFKGTVDMVYNPTNASTVSPTGGAPPGGERITLTANQSLPRPVTFVAESGGTFYAAGTADNNTQGADSKMY